MFRRKREDMTPEMARLVQELVRQNDSIRAQLVAASAEANRRQQELEGAILDWKERHAAMQRDRDYFRDEAERLRDGR